MHACDYLYGVVRRLTTLLFMDVAASEMKMLQLWAVFVLCLALVHGGFVGVRRDHVVNDGPERGDSDFFDRTALETKARFGDEKDFGRGKFILCNINCL